MKERDQDLKASALEEQKTKADESKREMEAKNKVKYAEVESMEERLKKMTVFGYNIKGEPKLLMTEK